MKKQMNAYINDLCGTDMGILKDIVLTKYKQFKAFYRAVEDASDDIDHVSYGITDNDVLSVKLYLADGADIDDVVHAIKDEVHGKNYEMHLKLKKNENVITISVSKK